MRALLLLALLRACGAGMNSEQQQRFICRPDQHTVDGGSYCTERKDGWNNGGSVRLDETYYCYNMRNRDNCECPDCGTDNTQCVDWRCDDENGVWDSTKSQCYTEVSSGQGVERVYSDQYKHDSCYKAVLKCYPQQCKFGEKLTGCMRASAGTCVACPTPAANKYFTSAGVCDTADCTPVLKGQYLLKACTNISNTVVASCDAYPGNPKSVLTQQGDPPRYYCPGNNRVLPLPAFSRPTADYSAFVCIDGYYAADNACQQCPQGSACKYGRQFLCPLHYYQRLPGQSSCKRCTQPADCSNGKVPYKCLAGSMADVGCVPCGMCGYSPETGHLCNEKSQPGLPAVCQPQDVAGETATCA